MADDLVQRLRMFAKNPHALSTYVARASVLGEAADALARKDAEITFLNERLDRAYKRKAECNDEANRERQLRIDAESKLERGEAG